MKQGMKLVLHFVNTATGSGPYLQPGGGGERGGEPFWDLD